MARSRHIHKYKREEWGKKKIIIWRCMIAGCGHYLHEPFIEGKKSLCWECGNPFVMTKDKMRRMKPKCDGCQERHGRLISKKPETPSDEITREITKLLEGL